jgi:hypothetical protein
MHSGVESTQLTLINNVIFLRMDFAEMNTKELLQMALGEAVKAIYFDDSADFRQLTIGSTVKIVTPQ